jgi:Uma2 family endonuclease
MRVADKPEFPARPVRFDFDEFVRYTEEHPEGNYELLDGVIYELAPEGDAHLITRLTVNTYLHGVVNLAKYTIGTAGSFPAPGWKEGPKPDNFVSRGALAQTLRRPSSNAS